MILFLSDTYSLDLSSLGITLIEQNNRFGDTIEKGYSFPFTLKLSDEILKYLGLFDLNNTSGFITEIKGVVVKNNIFYDGFLEISEIEGREAQVTLFFGAETLSVYDLKLKSLPFEIVSGNMILHANNQVTKQWPDVSHNFASLYRPNLSSETNYEYFEGFVNNYNNGFVANSNQVIEGVTTPHNKNVLVPMPYLMEVLRVGYLVENLTLKGSFVDDQFNHKILLVPDGYLERYSSSHYEVFSFELSTQYYSVNNKVISEYSKTLTLSNNGSYSLKFSVNLPVDNSEFFELTIKQGFETVYQSTSESESVNIDEEIVLNSNEVEKLTITLKLNEQLETIKDYNLFNFEFKEGKLNVFPTTFNLSDFMPDMTFREFVNAVKNWLNIEVYTQENVVYLNYIDEELPTIIFKDKTAKEIPNPPRKINTKKVFKLSYEDGSEVKVNKDGVFYADINPSDYEITAIDVPVYPLVVESNNDIITATYPEDGTLKLCLFCGMIDSRPLAVSSIEGRTMDLQEIHDRFWKYWLKFRTNSEIITDSYFEHDSETTDINKGAFKYNKKHIIRKIQTKSINKDYNEITTVIESF